MERGVDVGDFQMAPPGFGLTVSAVRSNMSNNFGRSDLSLAKAQRRKVSENLMTGGRN
jgi:hypothetical protein